MTRQSSQPVQRERRVGAGLRHGVVAAATAALLALGGAPGSAQVLLDAPPKDLAGIDITEKRGGEIPLDLPLMDHTGAAVRLGDYFDGRRPVILLMAYYTCPMLCGLALADLQKAVRGLGLRLGDDYRIVVLSFDHRNSVSDAATKRDIYVTDAVPMGDAYRRPASAKDDVWPFLLATEQNSRQVADAVGFAYRLIPETGEFAHPTALMVLTPTGKVSNYLYGKFGVTYQEKQMRLAVLDAANGKVGDVFDKILWACFHYDPTRGTWTMQAMTVMRIGGGLTALSIAGWIGGSLLARRRRARRGSATVVPVSSGAGSAASALS